MKARTPMPAPLLEAALTPTPLPEGEGGTGAVAHPFSPGEKVARRAG